MCQILEKKVRVICPRDITSKVYSQLFPGFKIQAIKTFSTYHAHFSLVRKLSGWIKNFLYREITNSSATRFLSE